MSQAEEEIAKFKLSNNNNINNRHYNYVHYGQMRMTKNNKQVMPLYENCTLNNNNNNNNNSNSDKQKPDHMLLLERAPIKSETFNYNYCLVSNTTHVADINDQEVVNDANCSISRDCEYENINFGGKESLDKKILLQKYFRSALVGPRSNIYENLCRGCNYGVFNARGPLCTFCECIVNGVSALRSETPDDSLATSNNIYENICEYCGLIYSGTNCTECKCSSIEEQVKSEESILENENLLELGSEELLLEHSEKQKKKIKISKSKSFNKTNKPKIFTNFWGTLRKPKSAAAVNKKPLEIIHHVEGYEEVFHTKDTFDLKKICELKRSATSCSDQHIYGRLKQSDLTLSQDDFNSTQSLAPTSNSLNVLAGKKPRISKVKFLRTPPSECSINSESKTELQNAATIYLNNSVCQWMTSLRHETHAYNIFNEHEQETLCYPKSIPSKSVLISCKAPTVTNRTKNLQNLTQPEQFSERYDLKNFPRAERTEIQEIEKNTQYEEEQQQQQQRPDYYQLMVEEFIANILNRQIMFKTKDSQHKQKQIDYVKALTMSGVSGNDSNTNNCNNSKNNNYKIDDNIDIPLRQAAVAVTTNAKMQTHNHNCIENNRHKRQGMYLRLEDHQHVGEVINLHNTYENHNNNNNYNKCVLQAESAVQEERVQTPVESSRHINGEFLYNTETEYNTVTTPDTPLTCENDDDLEPTSRCLKPLQTGWELLRADKRRGIHERNVLEAFEALLEKEKLTESSLRNEKEFQLNVKPINKQHQVSRKCEREIDENALELQTFGDNPQSMSVHFPKQILDIMQLIRQQQLSTALSTLIISYDKYLKAYLLYIHETNTNSTRGAIVSKTPNAQMVRKFKQFYNHCEAKTNEYKTKSKTTTRELTCISNKLKLELNVTNGYKRALKRAINNNNSLSTANGLKETNCVSVENRTGLKSQKIKTPPQVPKRDPKTKLSPTTEIKRFINHTKMTKPGNNLETETKSESSGGKEEESIYQPIWKFETRGKVAERYRTEDDYYDLAALKQKLQQESPNSEIPKILVSEEMLPEEEEDHSNWEPDEEFVFTKQMKKQISSSPTSERMSTIRSNHSSNSSIGTSSSLSGSTITEFASSTATLASTVSSSLRHYLFRNIGIFYSLTEPKLRAIIYDYDRVHSSRYFAKPIGQSAVNINDSGFGKSLSPQQSTKLSHISKSPSSSSASASTSSMSSSVCATKRTNLNGSAVICESDRLADGKVKVSSSVQAWKYQLLDINYMEDEEDMIVSECEILRAQQVKEDIDQTTPAQPQQFMQRFKSRSTENFLDLPIEDDKKTIAERLANMYTRFSPIQRGILNINGRNSPKSEKKAYKLNRASQSTSLYLEDGLKPKYPIFGAPLDQLELQQYVPRFVVDAVDYIERKDRITQDGIYRACGNKFSIDELKQKLTKSYIYDSKLIAADDIHTVTSLLKQFFRDLPEPVIPQEVYSCITANLADAQGIETIRIAVEAMKEPNKSTLRFLIKHLTNVAACSSSNRMNASNVAIVWGPSLFAQNDTYDMIGRMNTLTKVLIENYDRIFDTNERLL